MVRLLLLSYRYKKLSVTINYLPDVDPNARSCLFFRHVEICARLWLDTSKIVFFGNN